MKKLLYSSLKQRNWLEAEEPLFFFYKNGTMIFENKKKIDECNSKRHSISVKPV